MRHTSPRTRRSRPVVDETVLPSSPSRRMLLRALPALAVALGVVCFQAVRTDRGGRDDGPALSAAERSTRALLHERTAAHLRALRPR